MTIELLDPNEYDTLLRIQRDFPVLTFQNKGFNYINRREFSDDEKQADKIVNEILSKHIRKFSKFHNFLVSESDERKGELKVRFDYGYDERFTGVGYLYVEELLKGFYNK